MQGPARLIAVPVLALSTLVVASGCHHKAAPPAAPTPVATPDDGAARARADSIAAAEAARRAADAREAARADSIRRANDARDEASRAALSDMTAPIHFDLDRSDILEADRPLLERKAALMTANPALRVRIEGNTDERGSDEYNLALAMRRAAQAQRYLTERGIDASRLTVIANGEEHPVCQEHEESCWSRNRRDEFVILAGGSNLVARR